MPICNQHVHFKNPECVCMYDEGKPIREIRDTETSVRFSDANLQDAHILHSTISGDLSSSNMVRALVDDSVLQNATFRGAKMTDVVMHDTTLEQLNLSEAELTRAKLSYVRLYSTSLSRSVLHSARVTSCTISHCNLTLTQLHGAHFDSCLFDTVTVWKMNEKDSPFSHASFSKCYFANVLFGCKIDNALFERCAFEKIKSHNHVVWNCRFIHCDMSRLDLQKFSLGCSSFDHSVLDDANLKSADLSFCSFSDASLRNCNFQQARLLGTDLRTADITGSTFRRARYDSQTAWPEGMSAPVDAMNMSDELAVRTEMIERAYGPKVSDADLLWSTSGQPIVFTPAPNRNDPFDWIYEIYPDLFCIKRPSWAVPFSETVYSLYELLKSLVSGGIRVGDGVMPFETTNQQLKCVATHMANAVPLSMLLAKMEFMSRKDVIAWAESEIRKSIASTRRKARKQTSAAKTSSSTVTTDVVENEETHDGMPILPF